MLIKQRLPETWIEHQLQSAMNPNKKTHNRVLWVSVYLLPAASGLTLRELRTAASASQTALLALFHARVTCQMIVVT